MPYMRKKQGDRLETAEASTALTVLLLQNHLTHSNMPSRIWHQRARGIDLSEGDRVSHAKFGEGLVIEVKGNVASIMFDSVGAQKACQGYSAD